MTDLKRIADALEKIATVLEGLKNAQQPRPLDNYFDALPITAIGLCARAENVLHRAGISKLGQLKKMDRKQLRLLNNCGQYTTNHILDCLSGFLKAPEF